MKHHLIYFFVSSNYKSSFPSHRKKLKKFLNSGSHFFVPRHLRKTTLVASLGVIYFFVSSNYKSSFPSHRKKLKKFLNSGSHFFVPRHLRKTTLVASLGVAFRQISLTKKFPKSKIYVSLFYFFPFHFFIFFSLRFLGMTKKACECV